MQNHYSTKRIGKQWIVILMAAVLAAAGWIAGSSCAEKAAERLATCWILCKPGSQVNVRRTPNRNAQEVGFLEAGDSFKTDGVSSNGFIRCYGIGEYGEGWIYCGFVATEEPVKVFQTYVCAAPNRVACRRWISGPKTQNPWLKNGSNVQVFYIAGEWAVTSRGYIMSEWLEADPQ